MTAPLWGQVEDRPDRQRAPRVLLRRIPGGGLSYPVSGFLWVSQAAMASNGSNSKGRRRVMVAPMAKCSPCETTVAPIGEKIEVGFPSAPVRSSKALSDPP